MINQAGDPLAAWLAWHKRAYAAWHAWGGEEAIADYTARRAAAGQPMTHTGLSWSADAYQRIVTDWIRQTSYPYAPRSRWHRFAEIEVYLRWGQTDVWGRPTRTLTLAAIGVWPAYRRRGLGTAVIASTVQIARDHQRIALVEAVYNRDLAASLTRRGALTYARHGYVPAGQDIDAALISESASQSG